MLEETSHSKAIEEATKALYILNSDMTILDQCYARQDYERMHKMIMITMRMQTVIVN